LRRTGYEPLFGRLALRPTIHFAAVTGGRGSCRAVRCAEAPLGKRDLLAAALVEGEASQADAEGGEFAGKVGSVAAEFAAEAGAEAADVALVAAGTLKFGEEPADALGKFFGPAEVDGPLPAAVAEGDAVVGAERAAAIAFRVGDDCSGGSEKLGPAKDLRLDSRESHGDCLLNGS